ncbi:hypothetical protein SEA_BIANCATRI92_40 [Mycobacterium phage BiancaTri92]|nr:hypothetical protein SEA_LEOGANIA_40 [Mycobacterium phage Leogania]QGJ90940.1 hypothetical protein SEA_BIANCATRI92_40 [Mycobacterium phage BiancaTri92]
MSLPEVLVTDQAVYFDGYELPWFISQNGISYKPGGHDDFGRLRIEFLVSTTTFSDSAKWELARLEHMNEWTWLKKAVALEGRVQHRAIDRIMKEYM